MKIESVYSPAFRTYGQVLTGYDTEKGAPGQRHRHPKPLCPIHMAGGVVQRRGVDLHHRPGGDPEGPDTGGIQPPGLRRGWTGGLGGPDR